MILLQKAGGLMLYLDTGAQERCAPNKEIIRIICPDIWIHYILDGKGYFNGIPLGRGDGFIIYKNEFCEYYPDREDPWTYIWIRLSGEDRENLLKKCNFPSKSGIFHFSYAEKLKQTVDLLLPDTDISEDKMLYREAAAKLLLSLQAKNSPPPSDEIKCQWVENAKRYIEANYHKKITVEGIATALHIDRKYLRNLFVKYTGRSTKEYLMFYRLNRAKELLTISTIDIAIVASSVGYEDQLSFSRIFKKHVGLSPSEYRRQYTLRE